MKRLLETSVGWIEIEFSRDQRWADLSRLDEDGWVVAESEWEDRDHSLAQGIEWLGVPAEEARQLAEESERQWLERGGVDPEETPWWGGLALAGVVLATVGVWIAGVAFIIWLLVQLFR